MASQHDSMGHIRDLFVPYVYSSMNLETFMRTKRFESLQKLRARFGSIKTRLSPQ